MNAKSEEFLFLLCWTCETLTHSTFRNLTDSYEGWVYRNGFQRQLQRLAKQQLIERRFDNTGDRLYRLTASGQLRALGGRNPEACWNRTWDGQWRLVLFDLPESRRHKRNQLRRYLRSLCFGYLQNSVWITPDPVNEQCALLADRTVNVESLIFLNARPSAGETDAEIVAGAWDFTELNRRYAQYKNVLHRHPRRSLHNLADANNLHRWLKAEREAWLNVMNGDPLLPASLLPPDYPGRVIWRERLAIMAEASHQMRLFSSK
ncbi:MAG TPA: PaaX family transcriptional regulator C-terminal domain-containing protein [Candidatus Acidoferrum sp.]|nr:PaaX family transcriptional regulator C-terminal domain-containing protein [Candidatus Acidoferrum sp.]